MKTSWWRAFLCLAVVGGCGGSNESNPPPSLPAPTLLPDGQVLPEPAPRRYSAHGWPADFQLPLDIQIETEPPPPEIVGPSKRAN